MFEVSVDPKTVTSRMDDLVQVWKLGMVGTLEAPPCPKTFMFTQFSKFQQSVFRKLYDLHGKDIAPIHITPAVSEFYNGHLKAPQYLIVITERYNFISYKCDWFKDRLLPDIITEPAEVRARGFFLIIQEAIELPKYIIAQDEEEFERTLASGKYDVYDDDNYDLADLMGAHTNYVQKNSPGTMVSKILDGGSSSQVKAPPHFFKIILSSNVPDQKQRIPKKFISQYGNNLGNHVFLKVPSGAEWKVELKKSDNDVWMCNGWKEFAKCYSIAFGHLLVFRYDGNCNFHVLIFDMSASEIEYPVNATHGEHTNINGVGNSKISDKDAIEIDDSVEALGDIPCATYNTRKEEIHRRDEIKKLDIGTCLQTRKENIDRDISIEILDDSLLPDFSVSDRERANKKSRMEINSSMPDIESKGLKLPNQKKNAKIEIGIPHQMLVLPLIFSPEEHPRGTSIEQRPHQSQMPSKILSAFERAQNFKSTEPFCMVQMHPSYISPRYALHMPRNFARKYLQENLKYISLRISDGMTWSIPNLEETKMGRKPRHFPSFFKILIGDDFADKLRIPPAFVMSNLEGQLPAEALIKAENDSNSWAVKVEQTGEKNHCSFIRRGWRKFVEDCGLQAGDFLVFKLISNSVFEIVRYGPNGCEKALVSNPVIKRQQTSVSEQIKEIPATARTTRSPKSEEAQAHPSTRRSSGIVVEVSDSEEQTEYPRFVVVIKKHHRSCLTLPMAFARETGMARKSKVLLRNEEGKVWGANICLRTYRTSGGRIDLSSGWSAFRKENKIVEGDSCVFEFVRSAGNMIDVRVRKGGRR
ncbi:hypothetical protein Vadar_004643 [Vaccinium darrowii]|uniref:Uncharacterized protein n=1 Tax=Vaccinium darrowii TaxID=229202 RepID=A0ACB7YC35_9ERIC|nr:hypothetical protein Vadar_004643 [Vaccinium darrowii]